MSAQGSGLEAKTTVDGTFIEMSGREQLVKSVESLTSYRRGWLIHADSDYVAVRVLYYVGSLYPQVLRLCRDALEKYLKLLLLELMGDQAPPDGKEADECLQKKFGHDLVKLREACVSHARDMGRMVLRNRPFVNGIEMLKSEQYETSARYPAELSFAGNTVQIFDHLIHDVGDVCLKLSQETPLEVVIRTLGLSEAAGWPCLNREIVVDGFHHHLSSSF